MNLVSDDTVVLTMKDFLTESYLDLFENKIKSTVFIILKW